MSLRVCIHRTIDGRARTSAARVRYDRSFLNLIDSSIFRIVSPGRGISRALHRFLLDWHGTRNHSGVAVPMHDARAADAIHGEF